MRSAISDKEQALLARNRTVIPPNAVEFFSERQAGNSPSSIFSDAVPKQSSGQDQSMESSDMTPQLITVEVVPASSGRGKQLRLVPVVKELRHSFGSDSEASDVSSMEWSDDDIDGQHAAEQPRHHPAVYTTAMAIRERLFDLVLHPDKILGNPAARQEDDKEEFDSDENESDGGIQSPPLKRRRHRD